jgi:anti-sigma factor RsiW
MSNHEHHRAIDLITLRGVEEVSAQDKRWLDSHLSACSECAHYAEACDNAGDSLRSVAITASPALVSATRDRVRLRATQLQEQQSRNFLIAVSFCIGAMSSTISAWLWWRFGAWVAQKLALPASVVEPGVFVAWMLPAVVIAVVMLASSRPTIDRSLTLAILGEDQEGARP